MSGVPKQPPADPQHNAGSEPVKLSAYLPTGWTALDLGNGCAWIGRKANGESGLAGSFAPSAVVCNAALVVLLWYSWPGSAVEQDRYRGG